MIPQLCFHKIMAKSCSLHRAFRESHTFSSSPFSHVVDVFKPLRPGWPDPESQIPPSQKIFTAKYRPTQKCQIFYCIFGRFRVSLFFENSMTKFFLKNIAFLVKFLTFLLHKMQIFPESAQKRQILWAVKPKIFTAHQNLREPQIRFWAVGPPIWPP